jgi:hypothetical protein
LSRRGTCGNTCAIYCFYYKSDLDSDYGSPENNYLDKIKGATMTAEPQRKRKLLEVTKWKTGHILFKSNAGFPREMLFSPEELVELKKVVCDAVSAGAVLEELREYIDARIEGLDILLATPPKQRTESAQDDKIKEARFELGIVQDIIKRERGKAERER